MIISFFGHSQFCGTEKHRKLIIDFLERNVGKDSADLYLGGYGGFDKFAYDCCKKYKETNPKISLVFITPYMTLEYQKNHLEYQKKIYDFIIYPEIEDKPLKFAISYRNKWMVEKSDCVIFAVSHKWGGAYKTYQYAKRKKKSIFNLFDDLE